MRIFVSLSVLLALSLTLYIRTDLKRQLFFLFLLMNAEVANELNESQNESTTKIKTENKSEAQTQELNVHNLQTKEIDMVVVYFLVADKETP